MPGSWSSSANALEGLASAAKDVIFVVDDFAPAGSATDAQRANRDADRLLRGQGNRAGRMRMRSDTTIRTQRYPRGLILSTGEDIPKGHSLRARMFVLEVGPGDLDWDRLTTCQQAGRSGVFAATMAGYIRWLAPKYERGCRERVVALRDQVSKATHHKRTPGIFANLFGGLESFIDFAQEVKAIDAETADELRQRGWDALLEAAEQQHQHQAASEPARRFLDLLTSAITSGRSHLAEPTGGSPLGPKRWGWREVPRGQEYEWAAQGTRIGWVDKEEVYLDPDAALAVAMELSRHVGDALVITPQTLRKRLHEHGYLASRDEARQTLTVRRTLQGAQRSVLHVRADLLSPSPPTDKDDMSVLAGRKTRKRGSAAGISESTDVLDPEARGKHVADLRKPLGDK